jgi:hypothetical protein
MTKTLPNLTKPPITVLQLIFVIIPAIILSVILVTLTMTIMAIWQFISWVFKISQGISIYSHYHDTDITRYVFKEPINDRRKESKTTD